MDAATSNPIYNSQSESATDSRTAKSNSIQSLKADLQALRKAMESRVSDESTAKDLEFSIQSRQLQRIGTVFQLSPFQLNLLLCCLAPSIDASFDEALSKVSDDGKADVTPALLANIFGESDEWRRFCLQSNPLITTGLLFYDPFPTYFHSMMTRPLRATERLASFVLGDMSMSEEVHDFLVFEVFDDGHKASKGIDQNFISSVPQLAEFIKSSDASTLLFLEGPDGTGKLGAAKYLCAKMAAPLVSLDFSQLPSEPEALRRHLKLITREVRLFGAAVVVSDWHDLNERDGLAPAFLLKTLQTVASLIILTSEKPFALSRKKFPVIEFMFDSAGHRERKAAWVTHLNGSAPDSDSLDLESISGLYRFNGGQIKSIVRRAKLRRKALKGDEAITQAEIITGCREESSQKLAELAVKVDPKYSWDFLILPESQKEQLRELCNHMKYKARVYEEWAYSSRVAAPGLNALFTGPPGTGKTLAASIIAGELGLELYKIDLSTVVSKYIGETEKNLSNIFKEAEASNAVLFFDEADSLFGKRSAVNDSHDRYANIQVGYLLQKMEEFPGMTILASNLVENIDDAFMRRLHFSVDFPFPAADEREQIWRVSFPEQAPLDSGIDFERLGKRVKVPGGNIRNIALHAAFHAAADDSAITMQHIARAAKREYEKEGRSLDS